MRWLVDVTSLGKSDKESLFVDGKKVMEWQVTDMKFYNRLNPQQYFRPR